MLNIRFFALYTVSVVVSSAASSAEDECRSAFEAFIMEYNRTYSNASEKERRFSIFKTTYQLIEDHNSKQTSYTLHVNEFADQTSDEFSSSYLRSADADETMAEVPQTPTSLRGPNLWDGVPHLGTMQSTGEPLPESWDWVARGAVTPVKDQQRCGSCWAFAAIAALEGAWFVASGNLVPMSEQHLVDCVTGTWHKLWQRFGCKGGTASGAFNYVKAHGVYTDKSYSYTGVDTATCNSVRGTLALPAGIVTGYYDVPNDASSMMEAVTKQPISVSIRVGKGEDIDGDKQDDLLFVWKHYKKGSIITGNCKTDWFNPVDHAVLLVGYGSENGIDYWKVKNSWGHWWGEKGFARIERNKDQRLGQCNIRSRPTFPIIPSQQAPPGCIPNKYWKKPLECASFFTYKGHCYLGCTRAGSALQWCSLDTVYKGRYARCTPNVR